MKNTYYDFFKFSNHDFFFKILPKRHENRVTNGQTIASRRIKQT